MTRESGSRLSVLEGGGKRHAVAAAAPMRPYGAEPAIFLLLVDVAMLTAAFVVAYLVTPTLKTHLLNQPIWRGWLGTLSPDPGGELRPFREVSLLLLAMVSVTVFAIRGVGGYTPLMTQSRIRLVATSIVAPLVGLGAIALFVFAFRSNTWSRLFVFLFTLLSVVQLSSARLLLRWYRLRRIASGFYARSLVLVGPLQALSWLSTHVANNTSRNEYDPTGYLSISGPQLPLSYRAGRDATMVLPCLGEVSDLPRLLVHRPIHEVIAVHDGANEWLRGVVEACDYFRITLRIVPEALMSGQLKDLRFMFHSDPLRLPEIVLRPHQLDSTALFMKRLFDILVASVLLVIAAPLMALIAIAIKWSTPGLPVFFPWHVVGFNGRRFTGYKFSTMVEDAERRQSDLMARNEMQGPVFKIRDDPRVTRLGRVLRKYSLNELPQLWSVLKGDMSLVGPRPAFPHELERYELWHKRKLTVRPGMTCLWQVRGRNKISRFDDWVMMDLEYIDNWSLGLDAKILLRTISAVVLGSGS